MNAASLIRHLEQAGIRLSPNGERLRVEAKSGTVTRELRALIANRKSELLAELDQAKHAGLKTRQVKVETQLRARPHLRQAFDVASVKSARGECVSVVLAVRHGAHILSGELHIPNERWDIPVFLQLIDAGLERPS